MEELKAIAFNLKKKSEIRQNFSNEDKYADALKLAKKGFSPEEISKKTKMPLGEIELTLNLRKGVD